MQRSQGPLLDSEGHKIEAHGAGLLLDPRTARVYWFGESSKSSDFTSHAINCYSSSDLQRWRFEGVALHSRDVRGLQSESAAGWILERPKVLFNRHTSLYVMWSHLEGPATRPTHGADTPTWAHYSLGAAAVAIARAAAGPYTFVHAIRPPGSLLTFDASLFLDGASGIAYRVQDVEHRHVGFYELDTSFTNYSGHIAAVLHERREGVAPFFWRGRYYLVTSWITMPCATHSATCHSHRHVSRTVTGTTSPPLVSLAGRRPPPCSS